MISRRIRKNCCVAMVLVVHACACMQNLVCMAFVFGSLE